MIQLYIAFFKLQTFLGRRRNGLIYEPEGQKNEDRKQATFLLYISNNLLPQAERMLCMHSSYSGATRKYGNLSMLGYDVTVGPYAAPQENQCEWHTQVCETYAAARVCWREVAWPTAFQKTKRNFEDKEHKGSAIENHLREQHNMAPNYIARRFKILRNARTNLIVLFLKCFLSKN